MTKEEFTMFFDRLRATFPAVDQYFDSDRMEPGQSGEVVAAWIASLESVPLNQAMGAIHAMVAGELEGPRYPNDWARLPGIVRQWARDNKPLRAPTSKFTEHRGYRCFACRDTGFGVEIFNSTWMWAHAGQIERGELGGNWHREAARWCIDKGAGPFMYSIHCCCEAGQQQASKRRGKVPILNPEHECLTPTPRGGPADWLRTITEFVRSTSPPEPQEWVPTMSYGEVVGAPGE